MEKIKTILLWIYLFVPTALSSYYIIPYGWDKVNTCTNTMCGKIGWFLVLSPIWVFIIMVYSYVFLMPKFLRKRK